MVEAGLCVFPFNTLIRMLGKRKRPGGVRRWQSCNPERVAHCVEMASRFYPLEATCLKKALVLYTILIRKGFDARLFIGVAKTNTELSSPIDCHAWVEHQGRVIIGGKEGRYMPLYCCFNGEQTARGQQVA